MCPCARLPVGALREPRSPHVFCATVTTRGPRSESTCLLAQALAPPAPGVHPHLAHLCASPPPMSRALSLVRPAVRASTYVFRHLARAAPAPLPRRFLSTPTMATINVTADGGVTKQILRAGSGECPPPGSHVTAHYTGASRVVVERVGGEQQTVCGRAVAKSRLDECASAYAVLVLRRWGGLRPADGLRGIHRPGRASMTPPHVHSPPHPSTPPPLPLLPPPSPLDEGRFLDGNVFDSSVKRGRPFQFQLGVGQVSGSSRHPSGAPQGSAAASSRLTRMFSHTPTSPPTPQVIKAWDLGAAGMRKGEKCILTCRPEYGEWVRARRALAGLTSAARAGIGGSAL